MSDQYFVGGADVEGSGGFETATGALVAHLGDLSGPLYAFEVAERGFGYERWRGNFGVVCSVVVGREA